jgi:pimeloyl-ACP methyl ester carboxylesterase
MLDSIFTLSTGRKAAFAEYGDPQGVPLFYFHGWPSSRLQGGLLDEVGKSRGLRVVAPDRPGIGKSDFHEGRRFTDWPGLITELAAHLGIDKFYVMGVSGGGPYTLVCAHSLRERLLGAAVVCGAPPLRELGTGDLLWIYRLALWAKRWLPFTLGPGLRTAAWVAGRKFNQWPQSWMSRFFAPEDRRAMSDPVMHRLMMDSGREAMLSPVRGVRLDGTLYELDWGFDLGAIQMPVHFWHGAKDGNIPSSYCEKTAAQVPGALVTITPEDGHYSLPLLRSGEIVDRLMRSGSGI